MNLTLLPLHNPQFLLLSLTTMFSLVDWFLKQVFLNKDSNAVIYIVVQVY